MASASGSAPSLGRTGWARLGRPAGPARFARGRRGLTPWGHLSSRGAQARARRLHAARTGSAAAV
eukprot:579504-Pyramimonas_sp.AAC.1